MSWGWRPVARRGSAAALGLAALGLAAWGGPRLLVLPAAAALVAAVGYVVARRSAAMTAIGVLVVLVAVTVPTQGSAVPVRLLLVAALLTAALAYADVADSLPDSAAGRGVRWLTTGPRLRALAVAALVTGGVVGVSGGAGGAEVLGALGVLVGLAAAALAALVAAR